MHSMNLAVTDTFLSETEKTLRSFRNALLVHRQSGLEADFTCHFSAVRGLIDKAREPTRQALFSALCAIENESKGEAADVSFPSDTTVIDLLDLLSHAEAEAVKLSTDNSEIDLAAFVDRSFSAIRIRPTGRTPQNAPAAESDPIDSGGFTPDAEILEVFSLEAEELLTRIESQVELLASESTNKAALWEIRRHMHTFKGAAGSIGLEQPSSLAHQLEDLLVVLSDTQVEPDGATINLLARAAACLRRTIGGGSADLEKTLSNIKQELDTISSGLSVNRTAPDAHDPAVRTEGDQIPALRRPIVRVSIDRLDGLVGTANELVFAHSAVESAFAEFSRLFDSLKLSGRRIEESTAGPDCNSANAAKERSTTITSDVADAVRQHTELMETLHTAITTVGATLSSERRIVEAARNSIAQIRLIRFGSLQTRLQRAVGVTCEEEKKKALLVVENPDTELDTDVLDSLVEPLMHLVRNAIVHGVESPETRRLVGKPEAGQITVSVAVDNDGIELSVSDDGQGVDAAGLRKKAAEMGLMADIGPDLFGRTELLGLMCLRGLTTAGKLTVSAGRGVGMSIVRESVEARSGVLSVETQLHLGTTFTIRVPIAFAGNETIFRSGAAAEPPQPLDQAPGKRRLVLVADDSPSIRHLVGAVIRRAGYGVLIARDGMEALSILSASAKPDLIVTDIEMPRMDGHAFAAAVRKKWPEIPVVFITSRRSESDRETARQLGVSAIVRKPFNEAELVKTVTDQLQVI